MKSFFILIFFLFSLFLQRPSLAFQDDMLNKKFVKTYINKELKDTQAIKKALDISSSLCFDLMFFIVGIGILDFTKGRSPVDPVSLKASAISSLFYGSYRIGRDLNLLPWQKQSTINVKNFLEKKDKKANTHLKKMSSIWHLFVSHQTSLGPKIQKLLHALIDWSDAKKKAYINFYQKKY